jgi:mRNA interferase MazF
MKRGDVFLADLNPTRGSEQAGVRPVVLVQRNSIGRFTKTILVVPITSNLRRAQIPGTVSIPSGEGGLSQDSVALCYQAVGWTKGALFAKSGHCQVLLLNGCVKR